FGGDTPPTYGNHLQVFVGAFLEALSADTIVNKYGFGLAKLISDVLGVLPYTGALDVSLTRYLEILDDRGSIYAYNAFMHFTTICTSKGETKDLREWLKGIDGLEVVEMEPFNTAQRRDTLRIRKTKPAPRIPSLELVDVRRVIHPPQRLFRETEPPKTAE